MAKIKAGDVYDLSWGKAQLELRAEMRNWIRNAIRRQAGFQWRGGHDEGRYTCEWGNYYNLTGDETVKRFLLWLRDSFRDWANEHYYHGFQKEPNEHSNHAFENTEEFLLSLCDFNPEDEINWQLVEDVAHHVGNWIEGIPDWYDWERHKFVSHWLGTKKTRNYPPYDFGLAGHARIGIIVLYAYEYSKDQRYLDWCQDYLDNWVDIIMESEERIPMVVYPKDLSPEERMQIYNFGRERVGDPYVGNLWAANIPHVLNFMLHFNTIANEPRYLEAAQKAIALCEKVLLETEQYDRITDVYLNYQEITGEAFYQEKLEKWVDEVLASSLASEQILPDTLIISRTKGRSFGINVENSIKFLAGPTSSQYLKGFKVTGNLGYLVRSMRLAARELNLVTYSTRDGREHGCASHKFIHGCGEDAAHALYEATAIDKIRYYKADGSLGLDDDLAVMVDSLEDDTAKLYFYNRATEQKIVQVGFVDSDSSQYKSSFIIEPGVVNKVEVSK